MMSKRKNNITYIKPADPKFLQQIKQQIGYREGPTVDTKRQKTETDFSSGSDSEEETPQVVVLKSGDLSAEEAERERKRIEKEDNEKPADLTQKIVFKSKYKDNQETTSSSQTSTSEKKEKSKKRSEASISKLSFHHEDDEEEEEEEE